VILTEDKQFLARSAVKAPRDIRKPAVVRVQPIDQLVRTPDLLDASMILR
jgi:hypothetical protein